LNFGVFTATRIEAAIAAIGRETGGGLVVMTNSAERIECARSIKAGRRNETDNFIFDAPAESNRGPVVAACRDCLIANRQL
jgi:hypothetical protein